MKIEKLILRENTCSRVDLAHKWEVLGQHLPSWLKRQAGIGYLKFLLRVLETIEIGRPRVRPMLLDNSNLKRSNIGLYIFVKFLIKGLVPLVGKYQIGGLKHYLRYHLFLTYWYHIYQFIIQRNKNSIT